jgi:hypothetical protein
MGSLVHWTAKMKMRLRFAENETPPRHRFAAPSFRRAIVSWSRGKPARSAAPRALQREQASLPRPGAPLSPMRVFLRIG